MTKDNLRVALYARVSGEQQEKEDTIASQLEQVTMFNAYNSSAGVYGSYPPATNGPTNWWANTTVFNIQVATYLCPSDGRQIQSAVSNYVGNLGGPFALSGFTGTMIPSGANIGDVPSGQRSTAMTIDFNSSILTSRFRGGIR